jgi:hypothetical protein
MLKKNLKKKFKKKSFDKIKIQEKNFFYKRLICDRFSRESFTSFCHPAGQCGGPVWVKNISILLSTKLSPYRILGCHPIEFLVEVHLKMFRPMPSNFRVGIFTSPRPQQSPPCIRTIIWSKFCKKTRIGRRELTAVKVTEEIIRNITVKRYCHLDCRSY